jgi:hypothetical protein
MAKPKTEPRTATTTPEKAAQVIPPQGSQPAPVAAVSPTFPRTELPDRSHIITIPRPPEWDAHTNVEADSSDESSEEESVLESDEENTGDGLIASAFNRETATPERGLQVSFPHLELHGIELLEIGILNVIVKCERCKDSKDITNLQDTSVGTQVRAESCKKCAAPFALGTL